MPNWWMPPQTGLTLAGGQIGTPGTVGGKTPARTQYEDWITTKGPGSIPMGYRWGDSNEAGWLQFFGSGGKDLSMFGPKSAIDPSKIGVSGPAGTSQTSPTSSNPIPQNWMQKIADLMNKPAMTPMTPQVPSTQAPASSATNTGINNALQKLISGFGGGAATAQPTQMPSWWNTGRSVYPWGRGSTF